MGILDRVRAKQAERKAEGERLKALQADRTARAAAQQQEADEQAQKARLREILGPDLADFDVTTPDEAKIAIKLARLRKKELQAEKRDLAAELADVREDWRDRTAGRRSTVGLGRSGGARIVRMGVQAKRRGERMDHAQEVNQFSDRRQDLDYQITVVDRFIVDLERQALKG